MKIETKSQFNLLSSAVREALIEQYAAPVKISKIREALSISAGFKNHNNLLSHLPVGQNQWLNSGAVDLLRLTLKDRHGIEIDAEPVLQQAFKLLLDASMPGADVGGSRRNYATKQFVPASLDDFEHYARALAWLIETSERDGQILLTWAYGFPDLESLKKAILENTNVGPYDSAQWFRDEAGKMVENTAISMEERSNFLLNQICALKGCSYRELPSRCWKVRDIGLYQDPESHRKSFQRIRASIDVLEGSSFDSLDRPVEDYAYVGEDSAGDSILRFTVLGQAVFDACMDILPDAYASVDHGRFDEVEGEFKHLIGCYPNNPWPKAIWVCWAADKLYQGGWAQNLSSLGEGRWGYDADPGYREFAASNASLLFDYASEAIKQFQQLLGSSEINGSPYLISSGGEAFYWPAILYHGGCVAMNLGHSALAKRWFKLNYKITDRDSFGSRYYLAVLCLNDGKGRIANYFKGEQCDSWGLLALAAEALIKGNEKKARKYFCSGLLDTWATLEMFSGSLTDRESLKARSNHEMPAFLQEFMFRTEPFWIANEEFMTFFTRIATNPEIESAVIKYHENRASMFGMAFIDRDVQEELESADRILSKGVEDLVCEPR